MARDAVMRAAAIVADLENMLLRRLLLIESKACASMRDWVGGVDVAECAECDVLDQKFTRQISTGAPIPRVLALSLAARRFFSWYHVHSQLSPYDGGIRKTRPLLADVHEVFRLFDILYHGTRPRMT